MGMENTLLGLLLDCLSEIDCVNYLGRKLAHYSEVDRLTSVKCALSKM